MPEREYTRNGCAWVCPGYRRQFWPPNPISKEDAREAGGAALKLLKEIGIDDVMMVKVRAAPWKDWVAMYRGASQFRGRPIIWINDRLEYLERDEIFNVIVDSILHEYGHVIGEWGRYREPRITEAIKRGWGNEEEFAEDFMRYARHDFLVGADVPESEARGIMEEIVRTYRETAFEGAA